jgi:uncharacterized RDD family membrane protein YckC
MPLESSPALASRLTRLVGQFVDGLIGFAPLIAAAMVSVINQRLGSILVIAGAVFAVAYYFLADGLEGGQSWAKRWFGLAVVDARTGEPCGFGQSFVRNFLLAILGPLDWVFIFGGRKQRLGDIVAGTLVVARR